MSWRWMILGWCAVTTAAAAQTGNQSREPGAVRPWIYNHIYQVMNEHRLTRRNWGPSRRISLSAAGLLVLILAAACAARADPLQEAIRVRSEALRQGGALEIGGARVSSSVVLPEFYEGRQFRPAWLDAEAADDLLRAVREADADGLDPRDYHLAALERVRREVASAVAPSAELLADRDVLLSDAMVRLGFHLLFGKLDPQQYDPLWNVPRKLDGFDPAAAMERALGSGDLYGAFQRARPPHPLYDGMKRELARYRAIRASGGWAAVPEGPLLRKGMEDPRVPLVRSHLRLTGDLPEGADPSSAAFDETLEGAVRSFQERMGLAADGAVGDGTREALNIPVERFVNQLRVNLERGRWILHDPPKDFVLVNVANFRAYLFRGGRVVWQTRCQVGKPFRKTPIFRSEITYLVLNPTWTVPPGILSRDVLPAVRRDARTLARKGLRVLDRAGREVNPAEIDWAASSRSFPYQLQQPPGPDNALGRVKFAFPNPYSVYLHDTPRRDLFDRTDRAFSSGCIRVEKPLELAGLLLEDDPAWRTEGLRRAVDSGQTRTVFLKNRIPVLLLYWTAWVDYDGRAYFRKDIYGRDPLVLEGLNGGFQFLRRSSSGRKG